MTVSLSRTDADDLERFRRVVAARLGLSIDETRLGSLADVLERRARTSGVSAAAYLDALEAAIPARTDDELRALATELTVGETYFFRHHEQLRAFAEVVVPERLAAREPERRLTILSAGCASGEEPYSLAMLLRERIDTTAWSITLRAVDVDPRAIARAVAGRYTSWSLRETSPPLRERWFRAVGREHVLADEIREMVAFREKNLAHEDLELLPPSTYDVVFCRNVLMYFEPERAQAVIARIARALVPGGALFLGHAETLRGVSTGLEIRAERGAFFYEKAAPAGRAGVQRASVPAAWDGGPRAPVDDPDGSWVDRIREASERVSALADGARATRASAVGVPARERALDAIRAERFAEALEALGDEAADLEALVLRAVALIQMGRLAEGEAVCAELIATESAAVAQYLLGLCREATGDAPAASAHHRAAADADPSFAMPRVHAGLAARRAGDRATARRELSSAIELLGRESEGRIVLFGGGFSREALVALCRAELATCEEGA